MVNERPKSVGSLTGQKCCPMALDMPPLLQPPLAGLTQPVDWRKTAPVADNVDELKPITDRPISDDIDAAETPSDYPQLFTDESLQPQRRTDARTARSTAPGELADARTWDQARPIYNPRGAPSDGVPALSRLQARISFEPLYVHQYAATRYAMVSFMPWNFAERRAKIDLLA